MPSHKHKHKQRSSSPAPIKKEEAEDSFDARLERRRREKEEEQRKEKQRMKERETPEEKRTRRLAKKLQKEERRRAHSPGALPESIPYTDLNNPFNDANLTQAFVWQKKMESEGRVGISVKAAERIIRSRIHKNVAEMEELKRNRDSRLAEKEDMEQMSRDQDRSQYTDWRRAEDHFHLGQARLRTKIRLEEGRAKPIDLLARYCSYGGGDGDSSTTSEGDFDLVDPLSYLKGCSIDDYEDLLADIKVYRVLDGVGGKKESTAFWDDISTVAKAEVKRLEAVRKRSAGDESSIHSTVQEDVLKIFRGKSHEELTQVNAQIQAKIKNAVRGTDVGYWESLLEQLHPFMAKQRLKELHAQKLKHRLAKIKEEQAKEMADHEDSFKLNVNVAEEPCSSSSAAIATRVEKAKFKEPKPLPKMASSKKGEVELTEAIAAPLKSIPFGVVELEGLDDEAREQKWQLLDERQMEKFTLQLYCHGRYSPRYGEEAMPGIEVLEEQEDSQRLAEARRANKTGCSGSGGGGGAARMSAAEERMYEAAKAGMGKEEEAFTDETELGSQSFIWADKFKPRKPRYFNRVHTGFDWNKYNQTHYDIDNPPPKIVQGYRFNIFFPDLLDPTQTPSFKLFECEDKDFAIIRFKGGPPYEDIAFKVVNREWEMDHKHGYRCQFASGVFQLWFFFKRYRYRR